MFFTRIIKYILPYKRHFITGSLFALAFSVANGITLYSVVPIFDTLSPGNEKYKIELTEDEIKILSDDEQDLSGFTEKVLFYKASAKEKINTIVENTEKFNLLAYICAGLFLIICARIIFDMLSVYFIGYAGYGAIRDIRKEIYQSLLCLPLSFFQVKKTGGLISAIIYNTDLISGALSNQLRKAVVNIFVIITHIALLLYINFQLTLYSFIALIIITIPIIMIGRSFRKYTLVEQEKMGEISSIIHETMEGIRIIKSYQIENLQTGQFSGHAKSLFEKIMKKATMNFARPHIIEIISSLFLAFLFIYGGSRVLSGEYTKGEFIFFLFTFLFIMNPLKQVANMNNQIKQAEAAGEEIFNIIDYKKESDPGIVEFKRDHREKDTIIPERSIKFEDVSYKYPLSEKYALKNIDFSVAAGKTTAIVGRSGAGKTTLLDLIPRFFEPSKGRILIDDREINSIPLETIRNSTGIVTQEIFLFNGTIAENIAYGRKDIPPEKIIDAARAANAHDFISRMPGKYNTIVGERGIMLSGGERQRVAIARSILRNPPILILDEATSSLDTESERLVQNALNNLMVNRSSFVIAHRLSTIVNADLIIVLDNGEIVERGTHDELIGINGVYKKLYDIQFAEDQGSHK